MPKLTHFLIVVSFCFSFFIWLLSLRQILFMKISHRPLIAHQRPPIAQFCHSAPQTAATAPRGAVVPTLKTTALHLQFGSAQRGFQCHCISYALITHMSYTVGNYFVLLWQTAMGYVPFCLTGAEHSYLVVLPIFTLSPLLLFTLICIARLSKDSHLAFGQDSSRCISD